MRDPLPRTRCPVPFFPSAGKGELTLSPAGFAIRLYAFLYAEPGPLRRDAIPLLAKSLTFPMVTGREGSVPTTPDAYMS